MVSNDADAWGAGGCNTWTYLSLVGSGDQTMGGTGKWANLDISKPSGNVLMNSNLDLVSNSTLAGTATGKLLNNPGRLRTLGNLSFNYAGTVDDVEFLGNGSITPYQNLNINDSLVLTSVGVIGNCSNGTIKVKGNVVSNDADAWGSGGCNTWTYLSLVGSGDQTMGGTGKWANLDISKPSGNVLMNSNVDLVSNSALVGTATANMTNNGGILRAMGNMTFIYTGVIADLELLGNGSITPVQHVIVNNTLTLTSVSTIGNCSNGYFKVKGDLTVNDVNGWGAGGCGSFAYIVLNGTGNQQISGTGLLTLWEFAKPTGDAVFNAAFNKTFNTVLITAGTWNTFTDAFTSTNGFTATGGKIGGSGTLNGSVTCNTNGGIAPGASPGCLTVNGNVAFNGGSSYTVNIDGNTTPCTDFDNLTVNGNINYGATLSAVFGYAPQVGHAYQIVNASGAKNGNFGVVSLTPSPGITATFTPSTGILAVTASSVQAWYADTDGDGYGNPSVKQIATTQPSGYVFNQTDCNDANAAIYPGATEVCNGLDDNCDGQIDEGAGTTFYADADGDGYGNPMASVQACSQPTGYVTDHTDCNDGSAAVYPGATEICNGLDDDCDGQTDEGVTQLYYADADGDGFGDPGTSQAACSQPSGYVVNHQDCDDTNADLNPNTVWYLDADDDGYYVGTGQTQCVSPGLGYRYAGLLGGSDCNDAAATTYPGAVEICGNGIDDNCDSQTDEGCADIAILGNGLPINIGDAVPDVADGTDFGNAYVTGQLVSHAFTIHNEGFADLSVSGMSITGPDAAQFSIPAVTYPVIVAAGSDFVFNIVFDPAAAAVATATLSVNSNDNDENPYSFALKGAGINCSATVPSGTVYRWTNGGGNGLWSNPANWRDNSNNPGVPGAGATAFFSCHGAADAILDAPASIARLIVDASYPATLRLGAQTLTVTQEINIPTAGRLDAGTSLVKLSGSVSVNTPAAFYDVEILGNGSITPAQNINVNNTLIVTSVASIGNCTTGNILVKGNLVSNDADGWGPGGCGTWAYVILMGTTDQSISGTGKWGNLALNKPSGNVLMVSNVDLVSGATLTGLASNVLVNAGGKFRTMGNATLNFAGNIDDLEFQGNGSITPTQNVNVNNTLTITAVTSIGNCSAGNIRVKGNVTNNDATGWVAGGCGTWSYLSLVGNADQTLSGTGKWGNLDISKPSGSALMNVNVDLLSGAALVGLTGNILVNTGGKFRTMGNATLNFAGNIDDLEFQGNGSITPSFPRRATASGVLATDLGPHVKGL